MKLDGKDVAVKTAWHLNVWCNPTHLLTKSKELKLVDLNGHTLSFEAVVRLQVIGFLHLFLIIDEFGLNWQPSDATRAKINSGEVYFHAIEVASRSAPMKTRHILQAERILLNILLAADTARMPKKGAVKNEYRAIANVLGVAATPLLRKAKGGAGPSINGIRVAVLPIPLSPAAGSKAQRHQWHTPKGLECDTRRLSR